MYAFLWSYLAALAFAPLLPPAPSQTVQSTLLKWPAAGVMAPFAPDAGRGMAYRVRHDAHRQFCGGRLAGQGVRRPDQRLKKNSVAWVLSVLLSTGFLLLGTHLAGPLPLALRALLAPPWVMLTEGLRLIVYVAFRRHGVFSDLDREWLARLSGDKIRYMLAATVLSFAVLVLPLLIFNNFHNIYVRIAAIAGFIAGPLAAFIGKLDLSPFSYGSRTDEKAGKLSLNLNQIVAAIAILFGLTLFML